MPHDTLPTRSTDMDPEEFRRYAHEVVDRIADYLADPTRWPVLARVTPGELRRALPVSPPSSPEPMEEILADVERVVLPATTHWNHPGFLGYFGITGSGPGILGEMWAAALNVNAMLWRTGPAATELEEVALDWLRQLLGLPEGFEGTINDTASSSTLYALAAAREAAGLGVREHGIAGRADVPRLRVYCSEEAHSSVDKAALTLGLGLEGTARIPTDDALRMDVDALADAIRRDRAAGILPIAVVATVGTTSTTSIDPVPEIAALCEDEGLWLHVDAAYGGALAIVPEHRDVLAGCDRADSLVFNPHKWLFTPIDCSALYTRRPDVLERAFSLVPEYLKVPEREGEARNLMDYSVALGRRFRALKLWFVLRAFGADGIAERLRQHVALAREFARWVDEAPDFERLAPVPMSVVNFRHHPAGLDDEAALDAHNAALLERVNATGEVFLSHTRVKGRYAIHLAIGNLRTTETHVHRAWELLCQFGREAAGTRAERV